jgi:ornithine carbamoyltransferase
MPDLAPPSSVEGMQTLAETIAGLKAVFPNPISLQPLRGRNIGILCDDTQRLDAAVLQKAASDLGARAALVPADLSRSTEGPELAHTGRLLGRLYDAVICIDLPASFVGALRETAGVPVHSGVMEKWAALGALPEDARYLLQALLCP